MTVGTSRHKRTRIDGQRRQDVLSATVRLLLETGYHRFTFDRLAAAQNISKATLYRHWASKADLIVDAVSSHCLAQAQRDTGTLRGDLVAAVADPRGVFSPSGLRIVADLFAAALHDPAVATTWGRLPSTRSTLLPHVWTRALGRGEVAAASDVTSRETALVAAAIGCSRATSPLDIDHAARLVDFALGTP